MAKNKNQSQFRYLFGVEAAEIKPTCILVPFMSKGLLQTFGVKQFSRGNPYGCGNGDNFTLIYTHMGALFVGDAVLHLAEAPCQNLILFGACGLVQKHDKITLGTMTVPTESMAMEGFSDLLAQNNYPCVTCRPNAPLLNRLKQSTSEPIQDVRCVSFGSLMLESTYQNQLIKQGIDVLDMESAAFLGAAQHIKKQAIALLYVTDIVGELPAYRKFLHEERVIINSAVEKSIKVLTSFAASL